MDVAMPSAKRTCIVLVSCVMLSKDDLCIPLQVRQVVPGDKVTPLQLAKKLTAAQFVQNVDRNIALQLVTLTPLFTCLNDTPKSK